MSLYRKKNIIVAIFALSMVFVLSSCSQILNMALIPFAPDFVPSIEMTSSGAKIHYSISKEKSISKSDDKNWSRDYGYYIWRSTQSPYKGYELIKRIYIAEASGVYEGYSEYKGERTPKKYDFTVPTDEENQKINKACHSDADCSGTILDTMPLTCTCYYRVSKITLNSNHTKSDNGEYLSYSLGDNTSGWLSFGGNN